MRLLIALLLPWLVFFHDRSACSGYYLPDFAVDRHWMDTGRYLGGIFS